MDTSDFYDLAKLALAALSSKCPRHRADAIMALIDFLNAADDERAANKDHSHDHQEWRAGR